MDHGLFPLVIVDPLIVSSYPPFSLIPRHVMMKLTSRDENDHFYVQLSLGTS